MSDHKSSIIDTKSLNINVEALHNGHKIEPDTWCSLHLQMQPTHLHVHIKAAFANDPPPPGAPGSFWGLWNHEVVELFLLGKDERYLELEFGPHGHYLVLQFKGERQTVSQELDIKFVAQRDVGPTWSGQASIPRAYLPADITRWNAYRIFGPPQRRIHMAAYPITSTTPDFHKIAQFGRVHWPWL